MKVFVADRSLPGITMDQLARAQQAVIRETERDTRQGAPVRYLRSTFLPGDERCLCLFEAEDEQAVRRVNDAAGVPYTRVVEAHDLHRP